MENRRDPSHYIDRQTDRTTTKSRERSEEPEGRVGKIGWMRNAFIIDRDKTAYVCCTSNINCSILCKTFPGLGDPTKAHLNAFKRSRIMIGPFNGRVASFVILK